MSDGYDHFVSCLESRYDYQSARAIAQATLESAGIKEQAKYSGAEIQRLVEALAHVGEGLEGVWLLLGVAPPGVSVAPPEKLVDVEKPPKEATPGKAAIREPAAKEPAAKEPAAKEPAAKKPAAKKPAAKKPAAKKPAAKKPAAKKPAAKKPKK